MLEGSLEEAIPASEKCRLALAAAAAEIGAIAVSRAAAKADAVLANDVLEAVCATFVAAHKVEKAGAK